MDEEEYFSRRRALFPSLSLRNQLLLIFLLLLAVSITSLTIAYERSEDVLLRKLVDNMDDITRAIQISVEELTFRGDSTQRLKGYVDMLNKKGVEEITIIGDDSNVIASSDPRKIGTKQKVASKEGRGAKKKEKTIKGKDLLITARLGERSDKEAQRHYNVIMPVSIKGKNLGYILVSMVFDDFKAFQARDHLKRVLITLFIFAMGMVLSLFIAEKYTGPIKKIANASKKIARGELVMIGGTRRGDEIGVLVRSFNEMVQKLQERHELEEKLQRTEKLSLIGQLASGIAHEVRNPLNFLSLSIGHIKESIAEEDIKDRDEILSLLGDLTREIYRVNELINNFLFLGKPIVLNREGVSSDALINEVLYILRDKIPNEIEIRVSHQKDPVSLYCDRVYMRICLINLILNSVQAIEGKGVVIVTFGKSPDHANISVRDNGRGIGKEDLEKIYEPYFSTKKLGIGLGLAITKRLVEEHGGRISIESEEGKGTVTLIEVPDHEGGER